MYQRDNKREIRKYVNLRKNWKGDNKRLENLKRFKTRL